MGCDIHTRTERLVDGKWEEVGFVPFDLRNYGLFAFLAGVRNYSAVSCIAEPRGFPADASDSVRSAYESWDADAHTPSWLTLEELQAFDYDARVEDHRFTKQTGPNSWDGGATAEPGSGQITTWRKFLPQVFFDDLDKMESESVGRAVFWFDN